MRPRVGRREPVVALVAFVAASLVLLPDLIRLDHWTPFAQLIAFRPVLVVAVAIAGGGLVFVRRRSARWAAGACLAVCLIAAVLIAPRVIPDPTLEAATGTLTVASVNVKGGNASVEEVAALVAGSGADLVALPEAGEDYRIRLESALGSGYTGVSLQVSDSAVSAVSVLYRSDLGDVTAEPSVSGSFPTWELTGGELGPMRFVAFHAYPPLPLATDAWRDDLEGLQQFCQSADGAIIAGDFNATLDHSALRTGTEGCADAADMSGAGLQGTWPASAPGPLRAPIDHVFATEGVQADSVAFTAIEGTDHLAVVADLAWLD
ncbi:endonuclease/exonuclease/phosphatase family protein [Glycomyces rhizosphaerae]|uniref:Endonuclease/exonuclease/phosphatase family protein n=1 Tax=Glycomyces rhizosphaerae TaxID=2054422 RepID=A0ABV7Q189_9ACTN